MPPSLHEKVMKTTESLYKWITVNKDVAKHLSHVIPL